MKTLTCLMVVGVKTDFITVTLSKSDCILFSLTQVSFLKNLYLEGFNLRLFLQTT